MAGDNSQTEQKFIENAFGTVTNKRVIFFRKKGWFSSGSREDIPLQHVTSVRLETSRSVLGSILILLVGAAMLAGDGGLQILGTLFILWALVLLWGSPKVVVNTAGGDLNAAEGLPWTRPAATAFAEALREQLFNKPAV